MATTLRDTIITKNFEAKTIDLITPTSSTSSDTITFSLNNSDDNILLLVDTMLASPGNYAIKFDKGAYSTKAPDQITVQDGMIKVIAIESGLIEKKNATASFTVTTTGSSVVASGIRFALIKKRFVTNN